LFVARSVLLVHYLDRIRFPVPRTPRVLLSNLVHGSARAQFQRLRIADATRTLEQADLVNVSNADDRRELASRGIQSDKIVVIPFGMTAARRHEFAAIPDDPPAAPVVGFVGSFDFRKGAADFPAIFARIRAEVPGATLSLYGTTGHFRNADDVRALFPPALRPHVAIHPRFEPSELPRLLSECAVGLFPSYCEGFGFGVLEMLAAAMPVIAYDAPGPPEMLDAERMVRPGDTQAIASKVVELLRDRVRLVEARRAARRTAARFDWIDIARQTVDAYSAALGSRRQTTSSMVPA
jgi:glycosyltransferase involved in cell wall biosynthesis